MSASESGTASPGWVFTNDVLGNRSGVTPRGGTAGSYTWDCLNRMTASTPSYPGSATSTASESYSYRADGMRVEKILHSGEYHIGGGEIDDVYSRYRCDGQMLSQGRNPAGGKWSVAESGPMQTFVTKADSSTVETDHCGTSRN